ncbi:MAG: ATP synthase F1 subunit delta [Actinobacteria bacterium]|nr:ATP synthase F1 subunit delta [Actinomycetota bacterium]
MARKDTLVEGYAEALLSVAEAEGALEDVEDELFRFARTIEGESRLRDALSDPALPAERKRAMLADLLGERASPHTVSLLGFLVEQNRGRDLIRIAERLVDMAAERRAHVLAEVRAAVALDAAQRKRLAAALTKATGRRIELKVLVDPSVVGGVVARVGDQVFDGTIRNRFQEVREQMGSV